MSHNKRRIYIGIIIGGIVAAGAISAAVIASMGNRTTQSNGGTATNVEVFPVDSRPYGKSYAEWNAAIWKWFQEIPLNENPANDATGEFCDMNQNDPDVWFLAGTFGGKQERQCTIPAERALVILLGGVSCSYAEDPSLKIEEDLRRCAEGSVEGMSLRASIDGVRVQGIENYYTVSPSTPVTLPQGNVWNVQGPAETEFVVAGWTLVVPPLSEGKHDVIFSMEKREFAATAEPTFSIEAVYHLTIAGA